ncbi:MAG: hypothetical protein II800_05930 [Lachnospiraceae bacterium]|nr:hypothetical protein [Lachnospiraceae bacterium]
MANQINQEQQKTYEELWGLARSGKYREVVELASGMLYDENELANAGHEAVNEGLHRFINELTAVGEDRYILPENAPILMGISRAAGYVRTEVSIDKAIAMRDMEQKIYTGEVPGTEELAGNPDNRKLIRDIANSYIALKHPTNRLQLGATLFLKQINLAAEEKVDADAGVFIKIDGETMETADAFVDSAKAGVQDFLNDYQELPPDQCAKALERADLFESTVERQGFVFDLNAADKESIFSSRPANMYLYEKITVSEEAEKEVEEKLKENAYQKSRRNDPYMASSVNEVRTQFSRLFPGKHPETYFADGRRTYDLVFPKGRDSDPHPVFEATIKNVQESKNQKQKITDNKALITYKAQIAALSDRLEKDIDTFTDGKGEAGMTLATIAKARSSAILKNSLNGFPPARMRHDISLFRSLEEFKDKTSLTEQTLADIKNSEKDYPIYQAIASGYEAVQTTADFITAKDEGTLTAEKENALRADLYRQLKKAKEGFDVVKNTVPGKEEFDEREKLLNGGISEFTYGRHGGVRNAYADVEARLAGVENGWPIEDLNALSLFNIIRHGLNTRAFYNADGTLNEQPELSSPDQLQLLDKMDALFERLQTTAVADYARREEFLGEMSEIMKEGLQNGVLSGESMKNAAQAIASQAEAKLSDVSKARIGINANGKLMFAKNEAVAQTFLTRLWGRNFSAEMIGLLPKEVLDEYSAKVEGLVDELSEDEEDLKKYEEYREDDEAIVGPGEIEMKIRSLVTRTRTEDGQTIDGTIETARELTVSRHDLSQKVADEIGKKGDRYAKYQEYFSLMSKLNDTNGNNIEAQVHSPYLPNLLARVVSGPAYKSNTLDEIIDGLNQDPKMPLFDAFMDITTSGLREMAVEYRRQEMERRGFTEADEKEYLRALRAEHEKTIAAYDKIWSVVDNGQYDRFLDNKLRTVCGKTGPNERDISFAVGQLRGEIRGIENGWGSKDLHLFGYIGAVEQQLKRYREQLKADMDKKFRLIMEDPNPKKVQNRINSLKEDIDEIAKEQINLNILIEEYNELKEQLWNKKVTNNLEKAQIMAQFHAFIKKHEKYHELSMFFSPMLQQNYYEGLRADLHREVAEEAYRQMKSFVEEKDYVKLTQLLEQIEAGELIPDQPQVIRDAMERFITEITAAGPDGLVPQENLHVLEQIANQAGRDLIGPMLTKADELERMEEKVRSGQVPGTETFLDYKRGGAGDNREMIRDVVNNYIDQTSAAAKKEHEIRRVMDRFRKGLQAGSKNGRPVFQSGGDNVDLIDHLNKTVEAGMSHNNYKIYKDGELSEKEYRQKITRASDKVNDITKHGFEIDPNAKEGENIFSKVPEDVKKVQEAKSGKEIEDNFNDKLKASTWIAAYQGAVIQAAVEAQAELDRLEKMVQKTNSGEYIQMHDKLKAVAELRKEGALDKLTPEQVEQAFTDLQEAGATYERTHKGMFKGNIGTGRKRFNFSHDIQDFAKSAVNKIRQNNEGIAYDRPLGEQEAERKGAFNRARNAKNAADQVKEMNIDSLENKIGPGAGRPMIDFKALREKMNRMQQGPKIQGQAKEWNGAHM